MKKHRYRSTWTTRLAMWLAWHLPREVVYWCAIRLVTHAYAVPPYAQMGELDVKAVLDAWDEGRNEQ